MNAAADEYFDVVDESNRVIGRETRRKIHQHGLKHRAVHVLIFNQRGQLFLQKRSARKDCFPGAWDSSASGHLDCGETYDACAIREVEEELGLKLPCAPSPLFDLAACPETGQEFVRVYHCRNEGPFRVHPEEIERGDWFDPAVIDQWIQEKPHEFASAFPLIWKKYSGAE